MNVNKTKVFLAYIVGTNEIANFVNSSRVEKVLDNYSNIYGQREWKILGNSTFDHSRLRYILCAYRVDII